MWSLAGCGKLVHELPLDKGGAGAEVNVSYPEAYVSSCDSDGTAIVFRGEGCRDDSNQA